MDAHVFRIAGQELIRMFDGARLEKIHGPAPGVILFHVFACGKKRRLLLHYGPQGTLFFLSGQSPANPQRPSSLVMRLRKYAGDRRLGRGIMDYALRSVAFPVLEGGRTVRYIMLDLKQGPAVLEALPHGYGREPAWPDNAIIDSCCDKTWDKGEAPDYWQAYSVLTPLLRESLAAMEPMEGRALMADLAEGGGCLFVYGKRTPPGKEAEAVPLSRGRPEFCCAWPLPEPVAARYGLFFIKEVCNESNAAAADTSFLTKPEAEKTEQGQYGLDASLWPVLATLSAVEEPAFFAALAKTLAGPEIKEEKREKKRLKRLMEKLEQEERRLLAMRALREDACLLQAHLWRFAADEKLPEVFLPSEDALTSAKGQPCERIEKSASESSGSEESKTAGTHIRLDPLLTVRENMSRMFHQSARGARGLAILEERRKELADNAAGEAVFSMAGKKTGIANDLPKERGRGRGPQKNEIRDVAVFRSTDGHVMLRGKNARGNQKLLKLAQPYDLWLHARDGPSAHLVIRKNHAAEEIPESTLLEAAVLVGEKSWQRNSARAEIMVAYVKHVHPVKGAPAGSVRVDSELRGLHVALNE